MTQLAQTIVQSIYDAYFRADIAAFMAFLSPHVEWIVHGPSGLPAIGGQFVGPASVGSFLTHFDAAFEVIQFDLPGPLIADGPYVIATGPRHVRLRANGQDVKTAWLHFWRVENELVVQHQEFQNTAAYLQAGLGK
jgi:ketosteroid isomerase-like protein